jgi:hypothetical protein
VDDVTVPDFLVESFSGGHSGVGWILALWGNDGTFAVSARRGVRMLLAPCLRWYATPDEM